MKDEAVVGWVGRHIQLLAGVCLLLLVGPWIAVPIRANLARRRLLCKTDHQAVLEAGREMLRRAAQDGQALGGPPPWNETREMPKAIRDLRARSVNVTEDGYLSIEMHGGMTHFGFQIYPEDFKEPFPGWPYGNHRILDGLWYYDDEYKWPDYDEAVEAMLKKNRMARDRE